MRLHKEFGEPSASHLEEQRQIISAKVERLGELLAGVENLRALVSEYKLNAKIIDDFYKYLSDELDLAEANENDVTKDLERVLYASGEW